MKSRIDGLKERKIAKKNEETERASLFASRLSLFYRSGLKSCYFPSSACEIIKKFIWKLFFVKVRVLRTENGFWLAFGDRDSLWSQRRLWTVHHWELGHFLSLLSIELRIEWRVEPAQRGYLGLLLFFIYYFCLQHDQIVRRRNISLYGHVGERELSSTCCWATVKLLVVVPSWSFSLLGQ